MIRLTYVLRRIDSLSRNEFQDYWRKTHGPLVAENAKALAVRRYVQVHTMEDPLNDLLPASRGTRTPYDGVAELWWRSREDLEAAFSTPEGQQAAEVLHTDEQAFIDFSRSSLWLAREHVVIEGSPGRIVAKPDSDVIKLFYVVSMLPDRSPEESRRYWRENHGPLAQRHAQALRIVRYVQVHTMDNPLNEALRESRGSMEPYAGHSELWWNRKELEQALSTPEGQQGMQELLEDERRFVDFSRSSLWVAKEHVVIEE